MVRAEKLPVGHSLRVIIGAAERAGRVSERPQHEAVPGREDLFMARRTLTFGAESEHFLAGGHGRRCIRHGDKENVRALKLPFRRDAVVRLERRAYFGPRIESISSAVQM